MQDECTKILKRAGQSIEAAEEEFTAQDAQCQIDRANALLAAAQDWIRRSAPRD